MCSLGASLPPCSLLPDRGNMWLHSSQQQNKDQTVTHCHISIWLLLLSCSTGEISCGRQTAGRETLSFSSPHLPGLDQCTVSRALQQEELSLCSFFPVWEDKMSGDGHQPCTDLQEIGLERTSYRGGAGAAVHMQVKLYIGRSHFSEVSAFFCSCFSGGSSSYICHWLQSNPCVSGVA